jgi:glycosyltransferase involved in cell wall biosynthesis
MKPSVSLLVPVFNRADLLGACLDSALAQTMDHLEVVVVDGASTDGTWDVCLQYAEADPRVRVFRDPTNTGPVRGWWRCVEEAQGTYGTFLWSDDLLMPSFIERTLPFLSDDDVAFAYTSAEIGPSPGTGRIAYALASSRVLTSEEFILGSLATRGRYPLSPACALFRLDDIRRNFMMELPTSPMTDLTATGAGVDLLLLLLAAWQRTRVAHISQPLAFFRAHKGSISVDGRSGQVALGYALAKCWFARAYGRPDLVHTILAWHWLGLMRESHRFVSPAAAAKRYGDLTRPTPLLLAAIHLLGTLAQARLPWRNDDIPHPSDGLQVP